VGIESSRNQFVVDQSESNTNIELNGEVDVLGLYGKYIKKRGRTGNSSYEFRAETIASDLQIGHLPDINDALDEELRHYSIKYELDYLDDAGKRLHEGSIKYTRGKFRFGKKDEQDGDYNILSADYTLLTFLQVPFTENTSRLIFRSALQYSGTNLSPIARFSLAGPLRARGFAPNFFTADDALYLGIDWVFDSPDILDVQVGQVNLKEFARPFLFFDYGYGKQYTLASGEENTTGQLANVGVGLQFSYGYNFSGNLQLAYKVLNQFTGIAEPEADNKRLLFNMQYSF
jgi:hemolysin activation/secretion protein